MLLEKTNVIVSMQPVINVLYPNKNG